MMVGSAHGNLTKKCRKSGFSFVALLKACAKRKDLCEGSRLHAEIAKQGLLEKIPHIASTLINMYAKCGMIARAQDLHDELPVRTIASWNTLIAGYAQEGQGREAWICFEQMQKEGFSPDEITCVCASKACGSIGDMERGKQLHGEIVLRGLLHENIIIGNALVDLYAKCGMLVEAHEVHSKLSARDVVSWSALIAGYVQQGQGHEALDCLTQMQGEGLTPNAVTLTCIVRACSSVGAMEKGIETHHEIVRIDSLRRDVILNTALMEMYARFNMLDKARRVLDELPVRDAAAWNALIAGYVEQGRCHEALACFQCMQVEGLSPDMASYIYTLKACGSVASIERGERIRNEIVRRGLAEKESVLGTALVDMYAKCGMLAKAKEFHGELRVRSVVSWNAVISGFAQQGRVREAVDCLEQMQSEGFSPDEVTFVCILKACGEAGAIEEGKRMHDEVVSRDLLENSLELGVSLVDMYAKCGSVAKAQQVHSGLRIRSAISWNALMSGYIQQGLNRDALVCSERMQSESICPNEITSISTLKACGCVEAINKGKQTHCRITAAGDLMMKRSPALGNALIDMYARCRGLAEARKALEELPFRDVVAWSSLIAGYAQQEQGNEALSCLRRMQGEGICPNAITFVYALNACGSMGAMARGKQIHHSVLSAGLLEKDATLGNALVDMYAKCGELEKARQILLELGVRNVATWNALIAGYAQLGQGHEALRCIKHMQSEGIALNEVTYVCILNACSHSGLLDEAQAQFVDMTQKHRLQPSVEHCTCMVSVYGHAGLFEKALSVIHSTSSGEHPSVWLAVLGACRKWSNVKLGRLAFDEVLKMDSSCGAAYTLMADIYAAAGMQAEATQVGTMRLKCANLIKCVKTRLC